jgi:hypothetical protein
MCGCEELPHSVERVAIGDWSNDEVGESNLVKESDQQERIRDPE